MKTVLFDTDYIIEFLRGKSHVRDIIVPFLHHNALHISILTAYELYAGMREGEKQATDDFIHACHIEPVTLDIAKNAGAFRMKYRQKGVTLSIVDCIIAETARMNSYSIATMNKKHYPQTVFWQDETPTT